MSDVQVDVLNDSNVVKIAKSTFPVGSAFVQQPTPTVPTIFSNDEYEAVLRQNYSEMVARTGAYRDLKAEIQDILDWTWTWADVDHDENVVELRDRLRRLT